MSATYSRALRDRNEIRLDSLATSRPEPGGGHDVDPAPEEVFEKHEQAHVAVERRGAVELHEHIDITVRTRLIASHRSEERQRAHTESCPHRVLMRGERGEDFCASSHVTMTPPWHVAPATPTHWRVRDSLAALDVPPQLSPTNHG